jgi:hypothetical protein
MGSAIPLGAKEKASVTRRFLKFSKQNSSVHNKIMLVITGCPHKPNSKEEIWSKAFQVYGF